MQRGKYTRTEEIRRKNGDASRGRKPSDETRSRMSIAHKNRPPHSIETRRKLSIAHMGKKMSLLARENMRKPRMGIRGEKHPNWKGGITPMNNAIRHSFEYKLWRRAVFERDNYTCIWCGQKGGKLNADHIKPFADYPELRFAIDNGRTLCFECHLKTETHSWSKYKK